MSETRELTIRVFVDGVQVSEQTNRYKDLDWRRLHTFVAWRPWHVRCVKLAYRLSSRL